VLAATLSGCGGGGGGGGSEASASVPSTATERLSASSTLEGICTVPGQQSFVRSWLDEKYLWFDEIPAAPPSAFDTVQDYFKALLVSTPDASGHPRDHFSAVLSSAQADTLLIAAAGPAASLLATPSSSVPMTTLLTSGMGRQVGYVLFNDHKRGAQDALIDAFEALRTAQVQDLVLDLRHNSGGYLYVAQAAASMVTSAANSGRLFEALRYNRKREADSARNALYFTDRSLVADGRYEPGRALPHLSLPRVYVLASGLTCSASESIVNSLRGIDVEVVLIGETTCGKPYGFHRKDNCGMAYFAIEFQGTNAKGFGDYGGGFEPTCPVAEDPNAALGSAQEPLLAAALKHIDTGACPAASSRLKSLHAAAAPPAIGGRLLLD
jgi:hypothetical protein